MTFLGLHFVIGVYFMKHTAGDVMSWCSVPVSISTNYTSQLITEWFPGWSTEHACTCSLTATMQLQTLPSPPLTIAVIFNVYDVTTDVITNNCPLMNIKANDADSEDWVCPTQAASAIAAQTTFTTYHLVRGADIRFRLWNPSKRRIRMQMIFSNVETRVFHISCSPPSDDTFLPATSARSYNDTCPCPALQPLDNRQAQIKAVLIGILVPLLLLLLCFLIILLLWIRFGKTKRAWGTLREKQRLYKISSSMSTNGSTEVEYRYHTNITNASLSHNDTGSTISTRKYGAGIDESRLSATTPTETFDRGNATFSGYGDMTAYGICWTNSDVFMKDSNADILGRSSQRESIDERVQSSPYLQPEDALPYYQFGRSKNETNEHRV